MTRYRLARGLICSRFDESNIPAPFTKQQYFFGCHIAILSYCHTVILPYSHIVILSLSYCHIVILFYYHIVILSYSHIVVSKATEQHNRSSEQQYQRVKISFNWRRGCTAILMFAETFPKNVV